MTTQQKNRTLSGEYFELYKILPTYNFNFLHLTGIKYNQKASIFFKECLNNRISIENIEFKNQISKKIDYKNLMSKSPQYQERIKKENN